MGIALRSESAASQACNHDSRSLIAKPGFPLARFTRALPGVAAADGSQVGAGIGNASCGVDNRAQIIWIAIAATGKSGNHFGLVPARGQPDRGWRPGWPPGSGLRTYLAAPAM